MQVAASALRIGGFARFSTCDWPGKLAATVFCQGCVWNCPYCHNPHLRVLRPQSPQPGSVEWDEVLAHLRRRVGMLDAVVFSGGEPLLQSALPEAILEVKALGFEVGMHTTGMLPERFASVLPHLDWVGFDVKAPIHKYASLTGIEQSGQKAMQSLALLLASGVRYEVRTTFHAAWLSQQDLLEIRSHLLSLGVTNFALQRFRPQGVRAEYLPHSSTSPQSEGLAQLPEGFAQGFLHFEQR